MFPQGHGRRRRSDPCVPLPFLVVIAEAWRGRLVLHSDGAAGGEKCITCTTGPTQWPRHEEGRREEQGGRDGREGPWQGTEVREGWVAEKVVKTWPGRFLDD